MTEERLDFGSMATARLIQLLPLAITGTIDRYSLDNQRSHRLPQDFWQTFSKRRGERTSLLLTGAPKVSVKTSFQAMDIVDTVAYGRALFLDGKARDSAAQDRRVGRDG